MKYVIEIRDHAINDSCSPALYRVKGFRALVFDEVGLKKLKPFDEAVQGVRAEAYEDGVNYARSAYGVDRVQERVEAFKEGLEAGKEEMKQNVLRSINATEEDRKYKPELQGIFESCTDCIHDEKPGWAKPCSDCKHNHEDHFKRKPE